MENDAVLNRKRRAAEAFLAYLLASPARPYIARVILHGSVAQGVARPESDIDLIVFRTDGSGVVEDACDEAGFRVALELAESVEPLVYPLNDALYPSSYFVYRALQEGEELYAMEKGELKRLEVEGLYELGREYLEGARELLASGRHRLAVDAAYNAAELAAKGLILLRADRVAQTHGGVVGQLGELYIQSGELPAELGRRLHRMLRYRNLARYEHSATLGTTEAEQAIALAEELLGYLEGQVRAPERTG